MSSVPEIVLHDELNRAVRNVVARIDAVRVANAFIAALQSRRFAHWSALLSFALAKGLPEHDFCAIPGRRPCRTCGAYARLHAFPSNAFRTARETGIGLRDSLRYTLYDLRTFATDDVAEPGASDRAFFDLAIARIANVPRDATTFGAEKALGIVFPSRIERKLFLGVLGTCGVLASPARPGFWPAFVPFEDRAIGARPYAYPVTWWQRSFGIRRDALGAFELDRFLTPATLAKL